MFDPKIQKTELIFENISQSSSAETQRQRAGQYVYSLLSGILTCEGKCHPQPFHCGHTTPFNNTFTRINMTSLFVIHRVEMHHNAELDTSFFYKQLILFSHLSVFDLFRKIALPPNSGSTIYFPGKTELYWKRALGEFTTPCVESTLTYV